MGTNLANRSGPVTLGSVGLTGRAFTSGAPRRAQSSWFYWQSNTQPLSVCPYTVWGRFNPFVPHRFDVKQPNVQKYWEISRVFNKKCQKFTCSSLSNVIICFFTVYCNTEFGGILTIRLTKQVNCWGHSSLFSATVLHDDTQILSWFLFKNTLFNRHYGKKQPQKGKKDRIQNQIQTNFKTCWQSVINSLIWALTGSIVHQLWFAIFASSSYSLYIYASNTWMWLQ